MAHKGQTKYKATMPAELIEMFSRGKTRAAFCARHSIARGTFDLWLAEYPEFAEAYEIAKLKAEAWYDEVGEKHLTEEHEGPKLNTTLYSMIRRNRVEMTEHRKLKIAGLKQAKNFADQMMQIMNELANGNLTGSEAQQLAKLVETGVKVFEHTELEKRVSEIEKASKLGIDDSEFKEESV